MLVVTGATGALNGATVDHLLERRPAADIVVTTRDPERARRFAERGVEVRRGDYADPDTLRTSFAGADTVLLVSSNDPSGDPVAAHSTAIDAAVAAGVRRILYTSHQGAAPDTPFDPGRVHFATEQLLASSGVAWTSLRNGFYAHSLDWLAGPWRETGTISVPADGPVSWTSREDEAEAAAVILSGDEPFDGPVTLTASAAPTFRDLAAIASEISGRSVGFEVVDGEEWVGAQLAAGVPEFRARFTLGMYQAAEAGFFAGTDPTLARLLGREPRTARDALAAAGS